MNADTVSKLILDAMDDLVYIADPDTYELYYANAKTLSLIGNPPKEEWHRKKCYQVLQGKDEPCSFCTNKHLSREAFYHWEHYNEWLQIHFWIQDKLVTFEGITARIEVARDVTQLKQLQDELQNQADEQRTINDCISLLHSQNTPEESIEELLSQIAQYYQGERCYIFMLSKDGAYVSNTHEWCKEGVLSQKEFLQKVEMSTIASWFEMYEKMGEFYIDSIGETLDPHSDQYRMLQAQDIDSLVTAPLWDQHHKAVGFIGVDNPGKHIKNTSVIRAVSTFVMDFMNKNQLIEKLNRLSYYDSLTGLKNRHSYSRKLSHLQKKPSQSLGILYIDINGLKRVNDEKGHQCGDEYILSLSDVLRAHYDSYAYRIGGDEFVVILANLSQQAFEKEASFLKERFTVGDQPQASIGAAWSDEVDVMKQIELADQRMYCEKQRHHQMALCLKCKHP